jgi:hypothetical protein
VNADSIITLITSLVTLATVIAGGWLNLRSTKGVHSLVNKQHEDLVSRNVDLVTALNDANVKIPDPKEGTSNPQ